ncbi:protein FAM83A [Denticeps clupeoides]|uniref:Scaffolding anchor of CK1 domain-containing protein n=1 Tax=Denticeps clupeoides TaxID=299321 RepID=A0AAY4CJF0_9TELE|nr:protein FAM83A [Denticeps clupeoides]
MNLESDGLSVQCYLRPKPLGKVRRRLQEVRYPSVQQSVMDLSHNESARLATDALLDGGLEAYQQTLTREGEVDFLSMEEKDYILAKCRSSEVTEPGEESEGCADRGSTSGESQTYLPMDTDSNPPELDHGWPVADWSYHLRGMPSVEVFFQSNRSACMKDLLRNFIRKATTVLAVVMDTFSDVEILCDILEATTKRNVVVYLLLDHVHLHIFVEMCKNLQITRPHLTKMSIRSVCGQSYCAKSGRKFAGQIKEKFIIVDCAQVLVGSYSFSWLSWQVHRSLAMLIKGGAVKHFDLEFRRLYATSVPVQGIPVTGTLKSLSRFSTEASHARPSPADSSDSNTERDRAALQHTPPCAPRITATNIAGQPWPSALQNRQCAATAMQHRFLWWSPQHAAIGPSVRPISGQRTTLLPWTPITSNARPCARAPLTRHWF